MKITEKYTIRFGDKEIKLTRAELQELKYEVLRILPEDKYQYVYPSYPIYSGIQYDVIPCSQPNTLPQFEYTTTTTSTT